MTSRLMIIYGDGRVEARDVVSDEPCISLTVRHLPPYDGASLYWCLVFGDLILHVTDGDDRPTALGASIDWASRDDVREVYIDGVRVLQFR